MPVPVLLLFLIIYVPILLLTMLFIRSSDNVMKNTPRKRNLVVKAREVLRFQQYLFARAGYIALSVACIGWMTSAANSIDDNSLTKGMSIEKWADRLGSFERNLHDGSFTQTTLAQYHHVQDVMSCQMLFGLIMQLSTMMERGQELKDLFEMLAESLFLYGALGCIVLHTAILTIRFV